MTSAVLPAVPEPGQRDIARKGAGAIQIATALSLVQRKLFTLLLVNAWRDLGDLSIPEHTVPLSTLSVLVGFESKNTGYLKDAIRALVTTKVEWNIQGVDTGGRWSVSAALASAVFDGGVVSYAFSPELRRRLHDPRIYAHVDHEYLATLRSCRSSYGLALFEQCMLYVRHGATPAYTLGEIRALLGADSAAFHDTKRLMDRVVRTACSDVSAHSRLSVSPVFEREARRVVRVGFSIQRDASEADASPSSTETNAEHAEPRATGEAGEATHPRAPRVDNDLAERLRAIGLSYAQIVDMHDTHGEERLELVLAYVLWRISTQNVAPGKAAAYFVATIRRADPSSLIVPTSPESPETRPEQPLPARESAADRKSREQARVLAVDARLATLSQAQRDAITAAFEHSLADNPIVYARLRAHPQGIFGSAAGRSLFATFAECAMNSDSLDTHPTDPPLLSP